MRILHVITSLRMGGAEKLMLDLLPRLKNDGIEVELCIFDGIETTLKSQFRSTGIPIFELSKIRNVYHPSLLISLIKLIRQGNYDLIHTHNTSPQLFAAISSIFNKKIYITTEHTTSNRRRKNFLFKLLDKWMYSRYDKIISISKETEVALLRHIPSIRQKSIIINNGIDYKKYERAVADGIEKARDNCEVALTQIAAFRYQKDQKTVIRALKYLTEGVHAYFVGDGALKQDCMNLALELGVEKRTHFLGIREDVPSLLKASDIVVMSSHIEGFGLAAVEGMAAGKPVIASNISGLNNVVGQAGILFEANNEQDLAKKIIELIANSEYKATVANKCQERAKLFDISKMADKYKTTYFDLMKSPRR